MPSVATIFSSITISVLSGIILYLLKDNLRLRRNRREDNEKREEAIRDGLCSILRINLIEYHKRYVTEGTVPSYAFENWERMYAAYKNLGGNGTIKQMDEEMHDLKLKIIRQKGHI